MLTTFQKAVLATLAGSALLIALVLAAKGTALATTSLGTVGLPSAPGAIAGASGGIAPGVITTGDATVKVRPDIAVITVGATAQAATAAEAQAQVAERIRRILAAAKGLGIADKDAKTASYSISPQYSYPRGGADVAAPPRIVGYQAMQMVSLTLRKVDDAGKALDALVRNDGATNASVLFTLDDAKPSQAEARKLAIEDARAKADAMARTAGVKLGKVLSITDQSPSAPIPYLRKELAQVPAPAADSQVPVGDLEIVIHVQVQFAIE